MVAASLRVSRAHAVWIALILVMVLIEALLTLADHGILGSARWRSLAYGCGAFWIGLLHGWQPNFPGQPMTMFLSYSFLHGGWQHLLGNAVTLTWLGLALGPRCSAGRFAALYVLSALGGGIGYGLLARTATPMVGASGAIMGLIAVWIVWEARERRTEGQAWRPVLGMVLWMVAVVITLNLLMILLLHGAVAWQAHLGGFLAGVAAGLVYEARKPIEVT